MNSCTDVPTAMPCGRCLNARTRVGKRSRSLRPLLSADYFGSQVLRQDEIPPVLIELLDVTLALRPSQRTTAEQALQHSTLLVKGKTEHGEQVQVGKYGDDKIEEMSTQELLEVLHKEITMAHADTLDHG